MAEDKTVVSIDLDSIPVGYLILRAQAVGRQVDLLNEERTYLQGKIAERLARGEDEHAPLPNLDPLRQMVQVEKIGEVVGNAIDAEAPGAVIDVLAKT